MTSEQDIITSDIFKYINYQIDIKVESLLKLEHHIIKLLNQILDKESLEIMYSRVHEEDVNRGIINLPILLFDLDNIEKFTHTAHELKNQIHSLQRDKLKLLGDPDFKHPHIPSDRELFFP